MKTTNYLKILFLILVAPFFIYQNCSTGGCPPQGYEYSDVTFSVTNKGGGVFDYSIQGKNACPGYVAGEREISSSIVKLNAVKFNSPNVRPVNLRVEVSYGESAPKEVFNILGTGSYIFRNPSLISKVAFRVTYL